MFSKKAELLFDEASHLIVSPLTNFVFLEKGSRPALSISGLEPEFTASSVRAINQSVGLASAPPFSSFSQEPVMIDSPQSIFRCEAVH